jgi:glutamyl-tRNA synthetase
VPTGRFAPFSTGRFAPFSTGRFAPFSTGRFAPFSTGRFAPSPTGELHVGNLRTALVAWLAARSAGGAFVLRMEDLDPAVADRRHEESQRRDLAALGLDWDGPVWRQSERRDVYEEALADLSGRGMTYECFCTRREIRDAAAAPHGPELVYPGTCRRLGAAERRRRRAERSPAIRLRSPVRNVGADDAVVDDAVVDDAVIDDAVVDDTVIDDTVAGRFVGVPTDIVLRRNDGLPAYHLAVVVDDAAQGVDHVVRGDDLLAATPSQVALHRALGLTPPTYAHLPLVRGPGGDRLAKRDGAVTLADLELAGTDVTAVRSALLASLGLVEPGVVVSVADLAALAARLGPPGVWLPRMKPVPRA